MEKEKVHPAVCLITKHNYFKVGGCDENLVGKYGGTDGDFWKKWKAAGLYVNVLYDHYLTCDDEGKTLGIDRERGKQGIRIHEPIPSPPEHVRFPWEKVFP
jgi:hypothetical protein